VFVYRNYDYLIQFNQSYAIVWFVWVFIHCLADWLTVISVSETQ
jgi:hypothetical protein